MPTLDATVSGATANSYIEVAAADAILDDRPRFAAFKGASAEDKQRFLISAAANLDRLVDWDLARIGYERASLTQRMKFPRIGTLSEEGDITYPSTEIPEFLQIAQAIQAAYEAESDRVTDPVTRGIREKEVHAGPVSKRVVYDGIAASTQRIITDLTWKILGPWRLSAAGAFTMRIARA